MKKTVLALALTSLLSACGGGGGSSDPEPVVTPDPIVTPDPVVTPDPEPVTCDEGYETDEDGECVAIEPVVEEPIVEEPDPIVTPEPEPEPEPEPVDCDEGYEADEDGECVAIEPVVEVPVVEEPVVMLTRAEATSKLRDEINALAFDVLLPEQQAIYGTNMFTACEEGDQECLDNELAKDPDGTLDTYAEMAIEPISIMIGNKEALVFRLLGWHDHVNHTTNHLPNWIAVFNEDNTYTLTQMDIVGIGEASQIIDLNGDGLEDIYYADHGYDWTPFPGAQDKVYFQQDDGTFVDATEYALEPELDFAHGTCSADFDNNGYNDLVVTHGGHTELKMNYAGVLIEQNEDVPRVLTAYEWLIEMGYVDPAYWEPNADNGESWEDRIWSSQTANPYWWCETIDANNDGYEDVVAIGTSSSFRPATNYKGENTNETMLVMINDGAGRFKEEDAYYSEVDTMMYVNPAIMETHGTRVEKVDLNSDGYSDLVVMSAVIGIEHYTINFTVNDANGGFEIIDTLLLDYWPRYFEAIEGGFVVEDRNSAGPVTYTYDNHHAVGHPTTEEELAELSLTTHYWIAHALLD